MAEPEAVTCGHAAMLAHHAALDLTVLPWGEYGERERAAWDAAADAGTARRALSGMGALMGDILALRAERDEARNLLAAVRSALLVAIGNGPLLDPDCRDGKHASCLGAPCECPVPGVHTGRHEHEGSRP